MVEREDVAEMIGNSILSQLVSSATFGSTIAILYRNYPALVINPDYLIIFDSSEVGRPIHPKAAADSKTIK